MSARYILYGAGKQCRALCDLMKGTDIDIAAIVDSNPELWGQEFAGYTVKSPSVIKEYPDAGLCITAANLSVAMEIRETVQKSHCVNREIDYKELMEHVYLGDKEINKILEEYDSLSNKEESILFDSFGGLGLGGVESWTLSICEALIEEFEKNVYIVTKYGDYDVPTVLEKRIIQADIGSIERFSKKDVLQLVKIILDKMPCKIVTCATDELMLAAYLVKRRYPQRIEIISVIHNSNENMYWKYARYKEYPDLYVGVSADIVKNMSELGISMERLHLMYIPFQCDKVLHRGYSFDFLQPIRIGYAGRIEIEQKRMDLLLKVIEELIKKEIYFSLEIAGSGSYLRYMQTYIKEHSWNGYVRFCGQLERAEMKNFWKRQDICINVADYEGRSISITEAMGSGAVPVVTAVSGTSDDIADSVNGYLVDIGDHQAAAERIEYLYQNRELLAEMGKKAHDSVYPKSLKEPHVEFWNRLLTSGV